VGVILGERSNGARDVRMRNLIEQCITQAATDRTAPAIVERDGADTDAPVVPANFNLQSSAPAAAAAPAVLTPPTAKPQAATPAPAKLPPAAFQSAP
jgi:D-alanyl-D-alanine carboxypeptidase